MSGVELATGYVTLVPSFRGGVSALLAELEGVEPAAQKSGDRAGGLFSGAFGTAAKAGIAAAGVAVVAGMASALDTGALNDRLAAQLGLTEAESERIGGVAGRLYANAYGDSLGTVNSAVQGVVQNIDGMREASSSTLQDITARALDLSSAFDEDLAAATRTVGVMLRTGLADSAEEAFDILVRGYQSGVNGSQDLLDTFTEYPALFQRLGLDGETAMGLLNQGLQAGARNSDLVADALKEFQIRATDASTLSAQGFELLGLSAAEMTAQIAAGGEGAAAGLQMVLDRLRDTEDPVARNAAAVALFGTQAEDLGAALFALDPSNAVATLGEVAGASDRLGETLADNAQTRVTAFTRGLKTGLVDFLGNQVLPALDRLGTFAAATFGPWLQQAVAALGPVLRSAVDGFLAFLPTLLAFGRDLLAVAGPALASIGSILAGQLVPAFMSFYNAAQPILSWLLGVVGSALIGAFEGAITFIEGALQVIVGIFDVFAGILTGDWSQVWEGLGSIASGIWDAIRGAFQVWLNVGILKIFKVGLSALGSLWSTAWSGIRSFVGGIMPRIGNAVADGISAVVRWIAGLPGRAASALSGFAGALLSRGRQAIQGLRDGAGERWSAMLGWLRGLPSAITGVFSSAGSWLARNGRLLLQGLRDGAGERWSLLLQWFRDLPGRIRDLFSNAGNWLKDAGRRIISGLKDGIVGAFGSIRDALGGLTSLIPSWKGPPERDSILLWNAGQLIMGGLIGGIESQTPALRDTLSGITTEIGSTAFDVPDIPSAVSRVAADISANDRRLELDIRGGANDEFVRWFRKLARTTDLGDLFPKTP